MYFNMSNISFQLNTKTKNCNKNLTKVDKKLKFSTKNAENMSTKLRNNERD